MIRIFIENIEETFLKEANKKLEELLNFYFDPYDSLEEECVIKDIFPRHLYRKNKEKCINVAFELREYISDLSIHNLTPLHEYALSRILWTIKDIEEDLNRENIKFKRDEKDIESDLNGGFTSEDLNDIYFFLENCFQDYDFDGVEKIYDLFLKDPSIEKYFTINLEEYEDLVSEDIFREYLRIKEMYIMFKDLMRDKVSIEKRSGEIINNISSSVQGDRIYIVDSSLIIEEGDRMIRVLSNKHEERYIVINSDFFEEHYAIPAHYELKVRKETAIEHTQFLASTYIDNSVNTFNGDNNRLNKQANDYSTNISIKKTENSVFNQLRETILNSEIPQVERTEIITQIDQLEESVGKPIFLEKYQNFITTAANHMTLIAPLIPELTKLLPIS